MLSPFVISVASFLLLSTAELQQALAAKVDCYPVAGATKEKCEALGCVWDPVTNSGRKQHELTSTPLIDNGQQQSEPSRVQEPWCYQPDNYLGYKLKEFNLNYIKLTRARPSALGSDVQNVLVSIGQYYNNGEVFRIKIQDADKARFEPALPELSLNENRNLAGSKEQPFVMKLSAPMSNETNGAPFQPDLTITRTSTGAVLFKTSLGKLIFTDKFIQLNSELSSPYLYGLGEHYDSFLKQANKFQTYSFWNTDRLPLPGGTRSYGGFPFFVNIETAPKSDSASNASPPKPEAAHGIYLHNSNAMDIVLQNDASVTFRPVGGILDFFILNGPTPLKVAHQFQQLVGMPDLPPRWALGFHLCRYNYHTLNKTRLVWKRTRDAGIPFDVQWNDIDYMQNYNDFSFDPQRFAGLPEFVEELHSHNMHYIPIVDPGISQEPNYAPYKLGNEMDIWIKNATNGTLVGRVWNQSNRTVFPDFSNTLSRLYWSQVFNEFHKLIKFDGAWIDMNDISNFVDGSLDGCPWTDPLEQPPYLPGGYNLQTKTLCLSAKHNAGLEYDVHNLYSFYESIITKVALFAVRPNRRSLVISRSTHPGQGRYSGHWSGDLPSTWDYLRWSIASLLEHSMYGFSMMGSDICGFSGNTNVELCSRWSTLGAFYTFSRNHNDDVSIDQDPVALGSVVVEANKNALTKRYSLLPYLYTLMYRAHKFGEPVVRSVGFEFFFQHDLDALKIEHQFMWGGALMISPVVFEGATLTTTYLPEGRWYETDILPESMSYDANQMKVPNLIDASAKMTDLYKTKNISLSNMPLFIRGGNIIPSYAKVGATVADTELGQPIALEIALCKMGHAKGELYTDDGDSINKAVNYLTMEADGENGLKIELVQDDYKKSEKFGLVKVLGMSKKVTELELDMPLVRELLPFKTKDHVLTFDLRGSEVTKAGPLIVKWFFD